jgi:hypothetical protein
MFGSLVERGAEALLQQQCKQSQRNSMNTVKTLFLASSLLMTLALPALAEVNVSSPANNSEVESPFSLSATAATCSSQTVSSIGYSLDSSPDVTVVNGTSLTELISSSAGTHTLHVKAWGEEGSVCVTDVDITVTVPVPSSGLVIPANAIAVSSLQTMSDWREISDSGAKGHAKGSMAIVHSPSLSGSARKFSQSYTGNGDERYSVHFGDDTTSTNFAYDGWVYLTSSSGDISNVEMDLNQVMPNGQTVIYGVQCDGWSGTWDYTLNAGSPEHQIDVWAHTGLPCNPHSWKIDTWHHIQITYSRDENGNVTYQSVWLDGVQNQFNVTVPSAVALGWGPSLVTNFQVDGFHGSGSSTVYLDNLVIYRW